MFEIPESLSVIRSLLAPETDPTDQTDEYVRLNVLFAVACVIRYDGTQKESRIFRIGIDN